MKLPCMGLALIWGPTETCSFCVRVTHRSHFPGWKTKPAEREQSREGLWVLFLS